MSNIFYFIEARSPGTHVFSAYPIPRLGTVLLATMLRDRGYRTRVFIEDVARIDWKALDEADTVGISTITSTAPRAYKVADRLKASGKMVIMGGPHPTFMPDEALLHSDYVVRGEGEQTLLELLESLKTGRGLEGIEGLSWKSPGGNVHNPSREFIKDLDAYPAPDFSLVHGWRDKSITPIATSRGCPFNCRFCSVIHMFGRKYRFKSIDRVIGEIKAAWHDKLFVFFVDDNFTADRKMTKDLLGRLISGGVKFEWSAQVRCDAASDHELLGLMRDSGCTNVFIGFESVNEETLRLFNKKQDVEDITQAVRRFKEKGIRIHGMFVLGSDTDDADTIRMTERFARKMDIESVQFLLLTPLPGTPVFDELKAQGRLLHTDWSKYDALHSVFMPVRMTPSELQRGTMKALARFYSWRKILSHLARFNFYCGLLNYHGKRCVKKYRQESESYLKELEKKINPPMSST